MEDNQHSTVSGVQSIDDVDIDSLSTSDPINRTEIDVSSDEHPIKQLLGEETHRSFEYDAESTGQAIAFRYDTPRAAIRELIANGETACIDAAEFLLEQAGFETDDLTEQEILALAEDELGYEPQLEIRHSYPQSGKPALEIRDNGIGISFERYMAIKHFRKSTGKDKPGRPGSFGQGIMSTYTLAGKHGVFSFQTQSREDEITYGSQVRIDGMNDLDGTRDTYGTTITVPAFITDARDIDIKSAVETYTTGLRVPLLYYEYNDSGIEVDNEEYTPTTMDDRIPDSAPGVIYDDDMVEAAMSPETNSNRDPLTLLLSMPIDRNCKLGRKSYGNYSFWPYDLTIKREDGAVYSCDCPGVDHEGLVPLPKPSYEQLDADEQADFVPRTELSDNDIELPAPVDDRDRLEGDNKEFFREVADRCEAKLSDDIRETFEEFDRDGFDAIESLDRKDHATLSKWLYSSGIRKDKPSANYIQTQLDGETEYPITDDFAQFLKTVVTKIEFARRGSAAPNLKSGREEVNILDVLSLAGDDGDVYIGVTVNKQKARLAWSLHEDNQVVRVESTGRYEWFEDQFGWKKLKDLPTRNIQEKLDADVPQDVVEAVDNAYSSGSSSSSSSSRGSYDLDPKTRSVDVRTTTRRGTEKLIQGETVYHTLNQGEKISIRLGSANSLLILKETNDPNLDGYINAVATNYTAVASVPNYVYDYLESADNIYTSVDAMATDMAQTSINTFERTDGSWAMQDEQTTLDELSSDVPLLVVGRATAQLLNNEVEHPLVDNRNFLRDTAIEALLDEGNIDADTISQVGIIDKSTVTDNWLAFPNTVNYDRRSFDNPGVGFTGTIVSTSSSLGSSIEYTYAGTSPNDILIEHLFDHDTFPRGSPEWESMADENLDGLINQDDAAMSVAQTLLQLDTGIGSAFSSQK